MILSNNDILEMFDRGDMNIYNEQGGIKGFSEQLGIDLNKGVSKEEIETNFEERIRKYGKNILPDPPTKSWFQMFFDVFEDLMLRILLIAAIVSMILTTIFPPAEGLHFKEYIETLSILVAVLVASIVQVQTNYAQQKSFLEINKLKNSFDVNVIRDGHEVLIKSIDILKGEIVYLKGGDAIPADCLYIRGQDLKVNNSSQTGESNAILINEKNPFIFSGTAVETGFAYALVISIGENTRSGNMMKKIQDIETENDNDKSPLESKLDNVALTLTYVGLVGALLTFIVLLIYWIIDLQKKLEISTWDKEQGFFLNNLVEKFMIAVTIFICAVPEGIPLAVTLTLGFSMKRMMNDQNFVRQLRACETMGSATTICSDKTGTLTQNKMTITHLYMVGQAQQDNFNLHPEILNIFSESISLNTTAFLAPITEEIKVGNVIQKINKKQFVGNSSECALLQMIQDLGKDYEKIRKSVDIQYVHEFNSVRKRMSTIVKLPNGKFRTYLKGGPDFCLPLCSYYLTPDGEKKELTEDIRAQIMNQITNFASQSLRTMLISFVDNNGDFDDSWKEASNVENNLTIIAIVGIKDPLRPEVIKAVENCKKAGVIVRMVTGDFLPTAKAIAKECGILNEDEGHIALEGKDFAKLDKISLLENMSNLRVIARSSPMDKLRLVSFLMEAGEVVAVTGDGSNDSPALKQADVGLSMGRCGTELAKMASDIVILDDNFNSIVSALKWGRVIYDNVRAFIQYQLTVNFTSMILTFVGSVVLQDAPIKTTQLLWFNLIMDSFGAIALATRSPTDSLLNRQPYGRGDQLISNILIRNIIGQSIYQLIVLLTLLFGYKSIYGFVPNSDEKIAFKEISSLVFNVFVYMNVFNLINSRLVTQEQLFFEGLLSNLYFDFIFIGVSLSQVVIMLYLQPAFLVVDLTMKGWLLSFIFGFVTLIIGIFIRMIPVKEDTLEKLETFRILRREKIRNVYSNLSIEEQFSRKIDSNGEVILEKN